MNWSQTESSQLKSHDPIKRKTLLVFKNARKKVEVSQDRDSKQSLVEVNWNILSNCIHTQQRQLEL